MKLYEELLAQLRKEPDFLSDDGQLKKWVVADKARNCDGQLLALLLEKDNLKKTFFKDVVTDNGQTISKIFLLEKFLLFIEQKNHLNDSFTSYEKRIGLTIGGRYLKQCKEVELVWPYKDCILEGGQTKEDQKRPEIFFNQTLAQDEITQLLDPKVLTNAKRYDSKGCHTMTTFNRDAEMNEKRGLPADTITDNLIIKGNNLLALHSLKKEFAGKVKLIYIDPPYNTGSDSFGYNDNFNHSTWLTFMKNRLEVARELLSDDGSLYIQLDYNEVHYNKVLLDEIFGVDCFQREIIWDTQVLSGYKTVINNWIRGHDTILFYSKKENGFKFNKQKMPHRKEYLDRFDKIDSEGRMYFDGRGTIRYLDDAIKKGKPVGDVWYDIMSFQQLPTAKEKTGFSTQKPEELLSRIIQASTDIGDIILDFYGGSGTTASAAHKLNRQYITCEQIDSQIDLILTRLPNVINGDQSGISKSVGWNPQKPSLEDSANGRYERNNFVYLELKKYNQTFIEQIEDAESTEQLLSIWELMKEKSFISYNIDIKEQDKNIEEFKQFDIQQQKQILCELLDKNQLYVNASEMDDSRFETTDNERAVTNDFYKNK